MALRAVGAGATVTAIAVTGAFFTGLAVVIGCGGCGCFHSGGLAFGVSKAQLGWLLLGRRAIAFVLAGTTVVAAAASTTSTAAFTTLARFTGLAVAIGGLGFAFCAGACTGFVSAFGVVSAFAARCAVGAWTAVTTLCTVTAGCTFWTLLVSGIDLDRFLAFHIVWLAFCIKTIALAAWLALGTLAVTALATSTAPATSTASAFTAFGAVVVTSLGARLRAAFSTTFTATVTTVFGAIVRAGFTALAAGTTSTVAVAIASATSTVAVAVAATFTSTISALPLFFHFGRGCRWLGRCRR